MLGKIENENPLECAVSSVVEHYIDTVGVTGSNPVSRTIHLEMFKQQFRPKKAFVIKKQMSLIISG